MSSVTQTVKEQEYMFVEWSKGVSVETYDIQKIISQIRALNKQFVRIADIGGGIGKVAACIAEAIEGAQVDVVDNSELAKRDFVFHERTGLIFDDFLTMDIQEKYDFVIFRTVLHHFVAANEQETESLQSNALAKAREMTKDDGRIFVTENFYEPIIFDDTTGRLIFEMTAMKATASLFRSMGANTAGEGVRFRSLNSWNKMFLNNHLQADEKVLREEWVMPLWQKLPFFCKERFQGLVTLKKIA